MSKDLTARLAIGASILVLAALALLHILSPEFDPAWRMVSEYANGNYSWVLSVMFFSWAISSWMLAYILWSDVKTAGGKIGLYFLVATGVGEAMGGLFNINHPLHGLSALIGIPSLAIAAVLISKSLSKETAWAAVKQPLLWSAHLTWISILLMALTFVIMIVTFTQSGAEMPAEGTVITTLPDGVIGLVGWANRFLILVYCVWVSYTAWQTLKRKQA